MAKPDQDLITDLEEEHHAFSINDDDAGGRVDAYLANQFEGLSRSRFKDLIKSGSLKVNENTETSPNYRLKSGDHLSFHMPPPEDPVPKGEDIPLNIVFEDDDLIVVDKPANMVVHPAVGNWTGTLVNALIHHCGDSLSGVGGVRRPGIVHRLDKETSGLLVVAKNDMAHRSLSEQFADHGRTGSLERAYFAFVWGCPRRRKDKIETEIGRAPNNRVKMAVTKSGGRFAITHYSVVETFGSSPASAGANPSPAAPSIASLVQCHLETGRTHQIRVHMTHIGCPLLGDPVYGTGFSSKAELLPGPLSKIVKSMKRQALHAGLLAFSHPRNNEVMRFESALPQELQSLREGLQKL